MYILFQLGLIIAQHRDKRNHLSGIKTSALRYGLRRVYKIAKEKKGMQSRIITIKNLLIPCVLEKFELVLLQTVQTEMNVEKFQK